MVPDGCGCCKVCASQLNQDCHATQPCDHHKGLECNYGNDVGSTHGICRGESSGWSARARSRPRARVGESEGGQWNGTWWH